MDILIIATTKFELDGITNVIMNYYRAMDKKDMKIDFVVPNKVNDRLKCEIENNGGKIYQIEMRNRNPFKYIWKLSKLIKKGKYDIVHVHGNSCTLAVEMYAAKIGGAKVRIPHSHNSTCDHKIIHRILRRVFDYNYTHAFACGEKAGKWLYNEKPFIVINNGINVNQYIYDAKIREEYRRKYKLQGKKVVGHIGRFSYQKNHEFLIQVFNELYKVDNNYRLVLIGEGALRKEIEQQIKELNLEKAIILVGKSLEVPQLVQAMDMVIMPSRFEGLPLTLLETQTACIPCFVSDTISKEVAITDLIEFISLEKSAGEWAHYINGKSFKDRNKIKDTIYNKIIDSGYSIEDNAKKLKSIYKCCIRSN